MNSQMPWRQRAASVALLGAALLAGCSGDSRPDSGLIETTPDAGSQSADPGAAVTARYAEALRADTINNETVRLDQDGTVIAGTVSYDSGEHEIRFASAVPLDMMTSYRASLSNSILTTDGQPIEAATWSFRTRDGAWQDGEPLPQAPGPTFDREFGAHAYAADGSLWVVWSQHDEGWAKVFTSHRTSSGWSEPNEITQVSFENFDISESRKLSPAIAMNSQGAGIAVWLDPTREFDMPRTDEVWAARWDGTAWSAAERIGYAEGNAVAPKVSIDDAGHALVVWRQEFDEWGDEAPLVAQRYVAGVGWQSPQSLPGSEASHEWTSHLQRDGSALVAWGERTLGTLSTARFNPFTGWAGTLPLDTTGPASDLIARSRPDGSRVVVWTQSEGISTYSLWFAVQRADGSWQAPAQLEADVESHDLAISPSGDARLAYTKEDGQLVLTSRMTADANQWLPPRQVANVDPGAVRLVLDEKGRGVMVFEALDNGSRLWTSRLADPSGDAWSEPALTIDQSRTLRDLMGGPSGRAVLVMDTGNKVYADMRFE